MKLNEEQKQTAIKVLDELLHDNTLLTKTAVERFKRKHNLIPTIEVGKVYKLDELRIFVTALDDNGFNFSGYGIGEDGEWGVCDSFSTRFWEWQPINEKEWIEVLKKEGDKYIGKTVKCLSDRESFKVASIDNYDDVDCGHIKLWGLDTEDESVLLMKDGIWATIVEDVKETEVLNMYSTITVDGLEYLLIPKNNV